MTDGPAFYQRGNLQVPQWTTATRGPGLPGAVGFNTQTGNLECWDGTEWAAVGSGGGGGGGSLLSATVTLTSAEILSSFSSPPQVLAGVASKTIFVMGADFEYNHVTTDYTGGAAPRLVYHGDTSGASVAEPSNSWSDFSSSNNWAQSPNNYPSGPGISASVRVGLGVDFFTPSADPTGGDSTMTITVWYVTF